MEKRKFKCHNFIVWFHGNFGFFLSFPCNIPFVIYSHQQTFKETIEENKGHKAKVENQSFVDRSDFLALRSVDEADEGKEAEVGGISNIPMFSSSEEKLLEYNSLQVKKKQCCQLYI